MKLGRSSSNRVNRGLNKRNAPNAKKPRRVVQGPVSESEARVTGSRIVLPYVDFSFALLAPTLTPELGSVSHERFSIAGSDK